MNLSFNKMKILRFFGITTSIIQQEVEIHYIYININVYVNIYINVSK